MVIAIVCPHQYILCPYIIAFSHVQGSINNNTNQYSICKHIHGIHSCLIERKNTSSWPQPLQPSLSHHLYLTSTPPDGPQVGDYTYDLILICTVSQSCVRDVSTMYFYCRAFKRFYIKKRKPQFRSMCTLSFSSFFFLLLTTIAFSWQIRPNWCSHLVTAQENIYTHVEVSFWQVGGGARPQQLCETTQISKTTSVHAATHVHTYIYCIYAR